MKQQWLFPGVLHDDRRGTVRVTRVPRQGLQMNRETNRLSVVTYYDATWRGDDGGVERFCMTPESLEKMRQSFARDGEVTQ